MRKIIFWFHMILGISVGTIILILAVTGALLAFRAEIIAFAERSVRYVEVQSGAERLSLRKIFDHVRQEYPSAKPKGFTVKSNPQASMAINLGKEGVIYVDPYTGNILGKESKIHDFLEQVEGWHRWLALEGVQRPIGKNIKNACNVVFFLIICSGFYLWWPLSWRWSTFKNLTQFNPNLKGKARDWNWHNVIGFWCAPFLIVITVTGMIMSYQWANDLLYRATGNQPPAVMPKMGEYAGGGQQQPIDFDVLMARAKTQVSGWTLISLRMPQGNDKPMTFTIEDAAFWPATRRSQLTLNTATAEVEKWEPFSAQNLGRQLRVWARWTHTGESGGLIGKSIAFVVACGAIMLVWTGFAMAWKRFMAYYRRRFKKCSK